MHTLLRKVLVIALLVSLVITDSICLSITSATSYKKPANLLGAEIDVGLFEVEFDQDVFVRDSYGHCNMTCAPTPACAPCDYTDPAVCAGSRAAGICPCPVGPTCSIERILQLNSSYVDQMGFGEQRLFRLFANDPCNFVNLDLISARGDVDFYITTAELYDLQGMEGYLRSGEKFGSDRMLICPTEPELVLGTFVILVDGTFSNGMKMANGANYTLNVTSRALPFATTTAPSTPCTTSTSTHQCLDDDVSAVVDTVAVYHHFSFKIPKGCPVTLNIYSNVGLMTSTTNPYPRMGDGQDPSVLQISYTMGDSRLIWSTCNNDDNATLYITVTDLGNGYSETPRVTVTTNPGWSHLRSITSYNPFEWSTLYNTAFIMYGDQKFACAQDYAPMTSCSNFWQVTATEDPNPFYPRPFFSVFDNRFLLTDIIDRPANPLPNKFVVAVRLRYQSSLQSLPLNLVSDEQFAASELVFNGMFCDSNGVAFVGSTTFTPKQFICDFSTFSSRKNFVSELLSQQEQAIGQDIINQRYELDIIASSETFMSCSQMVQDLYTPRIIEETAITSQCTSFNDPAAFAVDPCCNSSIPWVGAGCIPRPTVIESSVLATTNDQSIASQCYAPNCMNLFINDYASTVSRIDNRATGCLANIPDSPTYVGELMLPFFHCRDQYFGVDEKGVLCFSDNECSSDGSVKCDMITHRCLNDIETQFDKLLACSIAALDRFVVHQIEVRYGIPSASSVGAAENFAQWRSLMSTTDCGNDIDAALPYRAHFEFIPVLPNRYNPECPRYDCLEPDCNVPLPCFFDELFLWRPTARKTDECTASSMFCNWMECTDPLSCASECLNGSLSAQFCGLCENGLDCTEFDLLTTQGECSTSLGCILHDGTVTTVTTVDQCTQQTRCNATCNGAPCGNEIACTTEGGQCAEAEIFGAGSCVFPHTPYYFPSGCDKTYNRLGYRIPTKIGCIDQYVFNTTHCQQLNGQWITAPLTKTDCEALGSGCLETKFHDQYNGYQIYSFKSQENCQEIGGQYKVMYDWIPATWEAGTARQLEWRDRAYESRYTVKVQTFDMIKLSQAITAAASAKYSFQVKTITQCRHSQKSQIVDVLACGCAGNGDKSESCFADYQLSASLAMQIACVGSTTYFNLGPSDVFIGQSSVATEIGDGCLTLRMSIASATEFRYTQEDVLGTFLINTQTNQEWGVFNDNNAMFGKVASDSLVFKYDSGTISGATICIRIRDDIQYNMSDFTVLDIALGNTGNKSVIPLQAKTWQNSTHYCGDIPTAISGNPTSEAAVDVYMFVWRSIDWQGKTSSTLFPPAEIALGVILVVGYAFNLAFCIYKEVIMLRNKMAAQVKFWIFACFGALSLVRCIYFILLLTGVLSENSKGIYVLVELPAVLYLSALSFYVIVWALSMRRSLDISRSTLYNSLKKIGIALNASMYFVFVLLLILYETIPVQPTVSCGGRLVVADTVTRYAIAMVYRLFISVLALALAVGFLIYGVKAANNLQKSKASDKAKKGSMRAMVTRTTIICSIGMILQCAFLLGLLFSGFQNNIMSMVILLLVEVGPIATIVALTTTTPVATSSTTKANLTDSSTQRRGTSTKSEN